MILNSVAWRLVVVVMIVAVSACIPDAAIRRGDAAAARGEWREAEVAYRAAVARSPNNIDLAKKYGQAKSSAIAAALRTAEACRTGDDSVCVDREMEYVLSLDPGNTEAARVRSEARAALAERAIKELRISLEASDPVAVWRHIQTIRDHGIPSGAEQEIARLEQESATSASKIALALLERARNQAGAEMEATLANARELASGAAARNTQYKSVLARIDEASRRAVAMTIASHVKAAEDAFSRGDFDAAIIAYDAAAEVSGDTTFQNRSSYARLMGAASNAIEQRAFDVAASELRNAIATQEDHGVARGLLDQVEPRVYRIRLESIAITPTKPGTDQPWVGTPWWSGVAPVGAAAVATWYAGPTAGKIAHDLTAAVMSVPPQNRPTLVTTIALPDGRRLSTHKMKGIYVIYGAEFFIYTNQLDNRTLRIAIHHERFGGPDSVAVANVLLGQIVSGRIDTASIQGNAQALQHVVFAVDPADSWQDGAVANVELLDQQDNRASARSAPRRKASRVQLVSASLVMPSEGGDGDGSYPDPYFEIYQGGRQIFRTATMQNTRSANWPFTASDLYLDPDEELQVTLSDADFASDDRIATWIVSGRDFFAGRLVLTTQRDTSLTLATSARTDRPR